VEADLLISGVRVIDGTGAPSHVADVAVTAERISLIGTAGDQVTAARRIDGAGKVLTPGFIDVHSHSGLQLLANPRHEAKIEQGVTTEVFGIDGISYAPFERSEDVAGLARMYSGLDGRPEIQMDWDSVASYLSRFDRAVAVNVAMLVGNSALRMGALGWNGVEADTRALSSMRSMLREAMEEGAVGLSTGLDYAPGAYASTGELATLAHAASQAGGFYHTHVRYQLGDRYLDPFREALTIGRDGSSAVHITHFYRRSTYPPGAEPLLALVDDAVETGMDVTFDAYPYPWSSTTLLILVPQWIQEGGPDAALERLSNPHQRPAIREALEARAREYGGIEVWDRIRVGGFRRPENRSFEARTLGELTRELGVHAADVVCDLLVSEDLGVNQVAASQDPQTLGAFASHPRGMVGTDSVFVGSKPSPRTFGSFPHILGRFVRGEGLMPLEEAVRKMTSLAAERLRLVDRGLVREGYIADLVLLDPATVSSPSTYDEPAQRPVGIDVVLVGGVVAVDEGRSTGRLNGRALRPSRPDR
jgi:N-acyl-D-amino-acid deacylase